MEYLFIYLLQLSERIDVTIGIIGFLAATFFVVAVVLTFIKHMTKADKDIKDPDKELAENLFKISRNIFVCTTISLVILSLIPTKQTLLLMGGTYLGKKAVNAVITDEKIKKVDEIINLQLDKYLKELKEQN